MKATRSQIIKIKIAQKQLGIDEETKLQQYAIYGIASSTELSYQDAEHLIQSYINAGFKPIPPKSSRTNSSRPGSPYGWGKDKYKCLDSRGAPWAASNKLRKIEALWRDVSRSKTDESLRVFIKNRTGIDDITMLYDEHANALITALISMSKSIRLRRKTVMPDR